MNTFSSIITNIATRTGRSGSVALSIKTADQCEGKNIFGLGFVKKSVADNLPFKEGDAVEFEWEIGSSGYADVSGGVDGVRIVKTVPATGASSGGGGRASGGGTGSYGKRGFGEAGGFPLDPAAYERMVAHDRAGTFVLGVLQFVDSSKLPSSASDMLELALAMQNVAVARFSGDEVEDPSLMDDLFNCVEAVERRALPPEETAKKQTAAKRTASKVAE